jgi:hypothetical protein
MTRLPAGSGKRGSALTAARQDLDGFEDSSVEGSGDGAEAQSELLAAALDTALETKTADSGAGRRRSGGRAGAAGAVPLSPSPFRHEAAAALDAQLRAARHELRDHDRPERPDRPDAAATPKPAKQPVDSAVAMVAALRKRATDSEAALGVARYIWAF